MKVAIALIILGTLGILQYIYFQFTPLALNYSYEIAPANEFAEFGVKTIETTVTRDWSLGIIGALIGVAILIIGVFRFRKVKGEAGEKVRK